MVAYACNDLRGDFCGDLGEELCGVLRGDLRGDLHGEGSCASLVWCPRIKAANSLCDMLIPDPGFSCSLWHSITQFLHAPANESRYRELSV